TRGEHAMRKGETITLKRFSCNTQNTIRIDDFKARESSFIKMFALISFLVTLLIAVGALLWMLFTEGVTVVWYGILTIPFLIYGSLLGYDRNRVRIFNQLYAKR
ncbi:hypothetical protein N9J07_04665, partial [Bacteroidia bacterium]|nr:hypothetical protein [Bacteroidia bacterium]